MIKSKFINEKIGKLRDLPMQTTGKIIETKERKTILTNDLEIHIIELPKLNRNEEVGEKLEEISSDEAKARLAELREKYILDYNTNIDGAEKRGIEKGRQDAIRQIAKKMLKEKVEIQTIINVTGLTIEEIEEL